MYLSRLEVDGLRVLSSVSLEPTRRLNIICGSNGAGKTTFLEAIHLLGRGRSFRTREAGRLVARGSGRFRVSGEVVVDGGRRVWLGVGKGRGATVIKVGGEQVRASSALAQALGLALITPESHRLVTGGPGERRRLLDWGMFHVEPGYLAAMKRYARALRQRNAWLRAGGPGAQASAWDRELEAWGERIARWREAYVEGLAPFLAETVAALAGVPVSVKHRRGWAEGVALGPALRSGLDRDRRFGATGSGPHRAELEFRVDGVRVGDVLSRGEAKLFVAAVVLGQVIHLRQQVGRQAVLLVDDLPSELDETNRARLMEVLWETGSQAFVTAVSETLLPAVSGQHPGVFHVEQGRVVEVV